MESASATRGWFGIIVVAVLAPMILLAFYPGWKTVLALILVGSAGVAGLVFGLRHRGLAVLTAIGCGADRLFQAMTTSQDQGGKANRVPRPTSYWKSQLIEAVGGQCEVKSCHDVGHLEVHHIDEHARGGGNALHNLLVLCPNHHKMAGSGSINKTRQRAIAKRSARFSETSFSSRWSRSVLSKERSSRDESEFGIGW